MTVRVRLQTGPRIRRGSGKNRRVALAVAALLWPAVLTAYVLGLWALGAEIQLTGTFGIAHGVFSRWQVWLAVAIALHLMTVGIGRYGREGNLRLPIEMFAWLNHFGRRLE